MSSLKSLKIKYIVQLILTYTTLLISMVIAYANVLPKFSVDYKLPTLLLLSIISILYSYILLIKNHYEILLEARNVQLKEITASNSNIKNPLKLLLVDYQFDKKIGYYKSNKTGELFCSICLLKNIPAPLKEFDKCWCCANCGKLYYESGYAPNKRNLKRGNGYNYVTDQ